MKKASLFHVQNFLCIGLLVFSTLIASAQNKAKTNSNKSITKVEFETPKGKITIFLPDEAYAGDIISGTVVTEPKGKNEKQKIKNKNILNGYIIDFADKNTKANNQVTKWLIPKNITDGWLPINLKDNKGNTIYTKKMPMNPKTRDQLLPQVLKPSDFSIPPYIVAGEPSQIMGAFDGDFANSQLKINGQKIPILAESPSGLFFETPTNINGSKDLEVKEKDHRIGSRLNILDLELSADKLNLQKGEQSSIHIKVLGLKNLKENVPMKIENLSKNIRISGGNVQEIIIDPTKTNNNGIYESNLTVTALMNGSFSVKVSLTPSSEEILIAENLPLCDCRIQGKSYLISPEACLALDGEIFDGTETPELPELPLEEIDSSFNISLKGLDDNLLDGTVPLAIRMNVSPVLETDKIVSVNYWYKHVLDSSWSRIEKNEDSPEETAFDWNTAELNTGIYQIKVEAVNTENQISQLVTSTEVGIMNNDINWGTPEVVYNVSQADVNRARRLAQQARRRAQNEERTINGLRRRREQESGEASRNRQSARELECIDEVLDRLPATYKDSLKTLIDSLKNIRNRLPNQRDSAILQKAVNDAKDRLKACQDRLKKLKNEKADLEKQRDNLKQEQDKLLADLDNLFKQNGHSGRSGYHSNGRYWYGYIGDDNSTRVPFNDFINITRPLREASRAYRKALRRLEQIDAEIPAAEEECNKLNEAYQQAKRAKDNVDLHAATQLNIDELCRQIRSLLQALQEWSANNPPNNALRNRLRNLMNDCPHDSIAWQRFWDSYKIMIDQKKRDENRFRENARRHGDAVNDLDDQIRDAEERRRIAEEEERRRNEEAEQLRLRRAEELAAARRAREARERERNRPRPEPILDEEINPSNQQLKLQASRLLYQLGRNDPDFQGCDCKSKAIIMANNTNTSITDLIGSIAVGVAFAPLEAFPGVGLAGKIGLGAAKALASSVYGGANFTDEMVSNLFNAIGGELFPKLTGDSYTGGKLNELINGGLKKIMEEEGVRAQSWEGTTNSRRCGRISGKTNLLFNPKTGWVVMMIKIPRCPLVIIKYRVNADGVPYDNTVSVREIR